MAKNTTMASASSKTVAAVAKTATTVDTETVEAVKEAFKAKHERDIQLGDETIQLTINNDKAWNDKDDDGKLALLELAETTFKKVSVADPGISVLVKKMTTNAEFMAEVDVLLQAERVKKASPVRLLAFLYRIYTKAEMDGMPMPGYDEEHAKDTPYKADKRSIKAGTGEPITTVWINDLASTMPQGKVADQDLDDLSKEKAAPGSIARFKGMKKADFADLKSGATADRNSLRSLLRRSIKMHHQWNAVAKLNSVGIRWIKGSASKGIKMPTKLGIGNDLGTNFTLVSSGPKPIWIYDGEDSSEGRDFSVTQLNAFQPSKIMKAEDETMMTALLATAGKGSDDDSGTDTEGTGEDDTAEQAITFGQRLAHFFGKVENKATITKAMAAYKKDATGADWMELIQELDKAIHPLAEKTRNTYVAIQNAKLANADNEAEAEVEAVA